MRGRAHVARQAAKAESLFSCSSPPSTSPSEYRLRAIDLNEASSFSASSLPSQREPHSIRLSTSSNTVPMPSRTLPWSSAPPPHSRPLYRTIPLPAEDTEEQPIAGTGRAGAPMSMSPTSPPPASTTSVLLASWPDSPPRLCYQQFDHNMTTSLRPKLIQLHPTLQRACLSPSLMVLHLPSELSTVGAQSRSAPATNPSLGYLNIVITRYSAVTPVRPSPSNPVIVTVGDVLDVLERVADMFMDDHDGERHIQGVSEGERGWPDGSELAKRIRVLDSLKLHWRASTALEGIGAGSTTWQLVVECR
ncbi:hypothetical protein Hypma_005129 [Hypsizygus marmoreus]|uniref:Uncharacterized protein n=1 Tax=Hypsizygus marmoreus TaxID=39966 RepID=A0A369JYY0_HYPMA|nr:hypothetical protein Hypma_005129 [Hypsizygus marmoreus]